MLLLIFIFKSEFRIFGQRQSQNFLKGGGGGGGGGKGVL